MNDISPGLEAGDPRLMAIFNRTVEKLKEVVREFAITEDELHVAGRYLNRLGQAGMCPSLVDVALAMTAVDVARAGRAGTRPNLEGPYHAPHPVREDGDLREGAATAAQPTLTLTGRILDTANGAPIPGARLDVWQADSEGLYDRKGVNLRGVVIADADGRYSLRTVVPSDYSEHDGDPIGELFRAMGKRNTRAAHIHFKVGVDGQTVLTTQLFMPTSQTLHGDYVEGAVSDDLILGLEPDPATGPGAVKAAFDFLVARPGA